MTLVIAVAVVAAVLATALRWNAAERRRAAKADPEWAAEWAAADRDRRRRAGRAVQRGVALQDADDARLAAGLAEAIRRGRLSGTAEWVALAGGAAGACAFGVALDAALGLDGGAAAVLPPLAFVAIYRILNVPRQRRNVDTAARLNGAVAARAQAGSSADVWPPPGFRGE